jgi:hypothetical protein
LMKMFRNERFIKSNYLEFLMPFFRGRTKLLASERARRKKKITQQFTTNCNLIWKSSHSRKNLDVENSLMYLLCAKSEKSFN